MFSWLGAHDRRKKDPEVFQTVTDGLKKLYKSKLLPLEEHYRFHEFHSPALDNADFDNKPMLLLVGQYSTGKTTFISNFKIQMVSPTVLSTNDWDRRAKEEFNKSCNAMNPMLHSSSCSLTMEPDQAY